MAFSVSPHHMPVHSEAAIRMQATCASPAIAAQKRLLPTPGGPSTTKARKPPALLGLASQATAS